MASELRARNIQGLAGPEKRNGTPREAEGNSYGEKEPLLDEDAIYSKHEMLEALAIEIELEKTGSEAEVSGSLCFRDGARIIDYILAYETPIDTESLSAEQKETENSHADKRRVYEENLKKAGLELEHEEGVSTKDNKKRKTHFVKIHTPWDVLAATAEEMMMKSPIRDSDIEIKSWSEKHLSEEFVTSIRSRDPLKIHDSCITPPKKQFVAYFRKDHLEQFVGYHDKNTFFSAAERSRMTERICSQQRFGEERFDQGIKRLIHQGTYTAAYPLHSGPEEVSRKGHPSNERQKLRRDWARFGRWFKYQPYDAIKDYFGTEIGLYFAWLGFYAAMLVPAAIFGVAVFIYGIAQSTIFPPVKDICNKAYEAEFYMCPLCDKQCPYWSLVVNCPYAIWVHAFDNDSTVVFAIFMSIWATVFLEFWKRRQAVLAYEWHMMHYEDQEEQPRPEFIVTVTTLKKDKVTGKMVPHVPKLQQYRKLAGVVSLVAFMIALVLSAVVGVVIYRASVYGSLMAYPDPQVRKQAKMTTSITAAILNLICINLLKFVYEKLAMFLTEWENPRTETDFKDSFTYKMYLFQFVNNYASIFYIAFFKLNLVIGTPGNYRRFAGEYRLDGCSSGGCLMDLCIQLVIIMVGQQIIGNITEIAIPGLLKWWKMRQAQKEAFEEIPRWEVDYKLNTLPEHHLFWEYLEVVLQFGFVTMFVAAFPLAPLFALVNAVFELRVDAINFVCQFRRPTPRRAQDIGAWMSIMQGLANISVLVNAFVIAFTSDFIPRLVYTTAYSPDGTLRGYLNNSLSYFNVKDYDRMGAIGAREKPGDNYAYTVLNYTREYCRYPGYHEPEFPYEVSKQYWHVIAARLAFVFAFQYIVYAVTKFVAWLVPDRPRHLELRIKRQEYLAKKALEKSAALGVEPVMA
ncbi:anoctamin-3 isoform X2 [Nematostella vectensis]|uniref:anoctamin-3 isoform X2 n=1 Tax=Nematostella vectensis TaxID=45351 RepID=UPI0013903B2D|nr:anoctamin-3 isoform X2 [Nematostella vectensis]